MAEGKLGTWVAIAQPVASIRQNATDGATVCEGQTSSLLSVFLLIALKYVFLQLPGELKR